MPSGGAWQIERRGTGMTIWESAKLTRGEGILGEGKSVNRVGSCETAKAQRTKASAWRWQGREAGGRGQGVGGLH